MRKEYDFSKMKWRPNPYLKKLKKSITIRVDQDVLEFFQKQGEEMGIPYQTLVNLFLRSCRDGGFKPKLDWRKQK
jgi:uncharacterized protein (DUF4415 family)